ncbi:Biopolymer transport protein ExbD/TolR [Polystyrenella longa]|uniref:Biopolymer transport protein ExbD/TolR n=1 Tax=Polystyrenella longa TaxID=2528007 RepID=A0A518CGK3_9PLAN|nr:biopolymer transporter ExbD [Polystyrenella longa]QDU78355.1 Biopolymer transport protein ExbD/TolR [Polystyrenella longa]
MRIRTSQQESLKQGPQMAPMIDIVFQLLIFFLLTLKIVEPEGEFQINMPINQPPRQSSEIALPAIKVRLIANEDGSLNSIQFGERNLGSGDDVFKRLNQVILQTVGGDQAGGANAADTEVEIDADYNLDYSYTIRAVSACTGAIDPVTNQPVRYVEKIKFTPPKRPAGAAPQL